MSKLNSHFNFFDGVTKKRSTLDSFLINLIGPSFSHQGLTLLILFISNFQKTLLYLSITERIFPGQERFGRVFLSWATWPIEYFVSTFVEFPQSYYALPITFAIILIAYLIVLLVMLVLSRRDPRGFPLMRRTLRRMGFVHQSVLYGIFLGVFLKMTQSHSKILQFSAAKYNYNAYIAFLVIFLILNIALAFIFTLTCYEPIHFTSDILGKRSNYYSLFSLFIKSLLLFFLTVPENTTSAALLVSILTFPLETFAFIIFLWKLPYYRLTPLRLVNTFAFLNLALCLSNFVLAFVHNYAGFSKVTLLIFVTVPFSVRFSKNYIDKRIEHVLKRTPKQIKSEDTFFLYFMVYENMINKGSSVSKLSEENLRTIYPIYLFGLIKEHRETCKVERCICGFYSPAGPSLLKDKEQNQGENKPPSFYVREQNEQFNELMYFFMRELLEKAILSNPGWHFAKLNLANLMVKLGYENKIKALLLLYKVEEAGKSYILRAKATQIKKEIETELKIQDHLTVRQSTGRLNIKLFVNSYGVYSNLETLVTAQANKHVSFWQKLEGQEPEMLKLLEISAECENGYQKIKRFWRKKSADLDPYFLRAFLLYGLYLRVVKNVQEEASAILKKAVYQYDSVRLLEDKYFGLYPFNMYNEENLIIKISLQMDKLGQIVSVSQNVEELLGYPKHLLVQKNVNTIMPEFIKLRHNDILQKYVNTGKTELMNKTKKVYVLHVSGYIIPFHMYIAPFPYIDSDYSVIAILKPDQTKEDTILTTMDGDIQGITENAARSLCIRRESMSQLNVVTFNSQFKSINRVFNLYAFLSLNSKEERVKIFEQSEQAYRDILMRKTNAFFVRFEEKMAKLAAKAARKEAMRKISDSPQNQKSPQNHRTKNASIFKNPFREQNSRSAKSDQAEEQDGVDQIIQKAFGGPIPLDRNVSETVTSGITSRRPVPPVVPLGNNVSKIQGMGSENLSYDSYEGTIEVNQSEENIGVSNFNLPFISDNGRARKSVKKKTNDARASILSADFVAQKRGSIFSKLPAITNDLSSHAKAILQQKYTKIYNVFTQQGQNLKFLVYDQGSKQFKEVSYFVKVHNEKVYDDILRVITLLSTENTLNRESSARIRLPVGTTSSASSPKEEQQRNSFHNEKNQKGQQEFATLTNGNRTEGNERRVTFKKITNSAQSIEMGLEKEREEENKEDQANPIINSFYKRVRELGYGSEGGREDNSSNTAKGMAKHLENKVERAVDSKHIARNLVLISRTVLLLFLITIVFLIWIAVNTSQGITKTWEVVDLVKVTYLRTMHILEVSRRVQQLNLTRLEFINIYSEANLLTDIETWADSVKNLNNDVRRQLHSLEQSAAEKIFDMRMELREQPHQIGTVNTVSLNPFEVTDQVVEKAGTLVKYVRENRDSGEIQQLCRFLEENILNGELILFQRLPDIEMVGTMDVFSTATTLNRLVLIFEIILAVVVLCGLVRNEQAFLLRKRLTLTALLTIAPQEIKFYKSSVSQLVKLMDSREAHRTLQSKMSVNTNMDTPRKKEMKRSRTGNLRGIYNDLLRIIAQAMLVLVTLIVMLAYLFIESTSIEELSKQELMKLDRVYASYFTVGLSLNAIYQYVSGSSKTIRGNPIDTDINGLFSDLKRTNDMFLILRGDSDQLEPSIDAFFGNNLCSSLFQNTKECQDLGGGVVMRGLTSVQNYLADQINNLKSEYDISDKNSTDGIRVFKFKGFIDSDKIYSWYGRATFEALMNVLIENFLSETGAVKTKLVQVIVVFVVLTIIILFPIWRFTQIKMVSERINVRRLLRMVQPGYVLKNKSFRAALMRDSDLDTKFVSNN